MIPSAGDELDVKPAGLLVAGVAFLVTRVLLVDVVFPAPNRSAIVTLARLVPMTTGLATVVVGVSLAVGTREKAYVRTVAAWYLAGSAGAVAVVAAGAPAELGSMMAFRASAIAAGAVVGGGVGGLLIGVQSARGRRRRRLLARRASQVTLLNRLVRHEVLNALTAIRGHAGLLADGEGDERSRDAVERNADRIERAVDDVGSLARAIGEERATLGPVDLGAAVDRVRRRFAAADRPIRVAGDGSAAGEGDGTREDGGGPEFPSVAVRADDHLDTVVAELAALALDRASGPVTLGLSVRETTAGFELSAPGSWLDGPARDVLLDGLPLHENPNVAYGVPIVHLLVSEYGGEIDVRDGPDGTTVAVALPRTGRNVPPGDSPGVRPAALRDAAVAGLLAGGAMGLVLRALSGEIGVIGSLYGVPTAAVGWLTHLFHSVVFAIVFVAALTRRRAAAGAARLAALGVGYGVLLWLVVAGIVMGVWLNAVGIGVDVPNLSAVSLLAHVVWGLSLGLLVRALRTAGGSAAGPDTPRAPAADTALAADTAPDTDTDTATDGDADAAD